MVGADADDIEEGKAGRKLARRSTQRIERDVDRNVELRLQRLDQDAGLGLNAARSEEHTSELQSHSDLVCRLLLEKKKINESSTRTVSEVFQSSTLHYDLVSVSQRVNRVRTRVLVGV